MALIANLIIGADGSTSIDGNSKKLSSPSDRKRFHNLRSQVNAIVIGGETARKEPYKSTPLPLYVISRKERIPEIDGNNLASLNNAEPKVFINKLKSEIEGDILFEGGPNLLSEIIDLVDHLYITISNKTGDGQAISFDGLTRNFVMEDKEVIEDETFYKFKKLK